MFKEWSLEKKDFVKNGFEPKASNGKLLEGKFTVPTWVNQDTIIANVLLHKKEFGAGHSWVTEHGDPENPQDLVHIKKYAPLENLSLTQKYPAVLITDSVWDQRVHPWHGRIFEYVFEQNPNTKTYFLESSDSGHGSGSDLKM